MKIVKKICLLLCLVLVFSSLHPSSVNATSNVNAASKKSSLQKKNAAAKTAFKKILTKNYKSDLTQTMENGLKYKFIDLDGDKIVELVLWNSYSDILVYRYQNKKAVKILEYTCFGNPDHGEGPKKMYYSSKTKIIRIRSVENDGYGRHAYVDTWYKLGKNKKYKKISEGSRSFDYYIIDGKTVSKKEYSKYVSKISKKLTQVPKWSKYKNNKFKAVWSTTQICKDEFDGNYYGDYPKFKKISYKGNTITITGVMNCTFNQNTQTVGFGTYKFELASNCQFIDVGYFDIKMTKKDYFSLANSQVGLYIVFYQNKQGKIYRMEISS